MAEGMDESIPSYVMEALLDSFSESDSDVGDISGDFSGNANDESQPDLLGSYSDVASDDDSTVETYDLGTVLSFIDDDDLPEYDFKKNETPHVNPAFLPVSPPGPTCATPPGRGTALDYFQLFYDDSFLGAIVDFTNRNAATRQLAGDKSYGQWADISVQELKAYYAVRLLIETNFKDRIHTAWEGHNDKTWLLAMPGISRVFTRSRYHQITKFLHYCDESDVPARDEPMHDKLYKVRFITDHLGKRFAEEFTPHQQVAVDECMIPFRGRLSFKQYHKDKPTKWGIKVWMLADSQTGYNYSFDVYTGKDADLDTMQNIGKVSGVVLKLAKSLFGKGYTIFFDRFYTSPNLLYWLRRVDLSGCGTAMTNRCGFPKQLKSTGRSQQGEYDWLQCQKTGILATRWCDKRDIYFLSNHVIAEVDNLVIKRHNKVGNSINVPCTPTVVEYNRYMGAVDFNDKMCRLDKTRRTYKWYVRIDRKCVAWALFNAFVIEEKFRAHGRKRDFRQFTVEVIHQLVGDSRFRCLKRGRPSTAVTLPSRITQSSHFPVKGEGVDHLCVVCAEKHHRYKRANPTSTYAENPNKKVKTSFKCDGCSSYLCLKKDSTCWQDWHTKLEYWH